MKIIHTADWHLGNVFHGHHRTEEHRHFLQWLLDRLRETQPDVLLITGDIFDSANPSARAEELFYSFLMQATAAVSGLQIVITAGNHDSAGRLEAPAAMLRTHNIYVRGTIRTDADGLPDFSHYLLPLSSRMESEAQCVCFALPYLRSSDYPAGLTPEEGLRYYFEHLHRALRKSDFRGLPVVAAAHFYATGADICADEHSERLVVGGQECVSADVAGRGVAYAALGHIHKAQQLGASSCVCYAGSALPMSFSEIRYRHGVQCIELSASGDVSVSRLDYSPLRALVSLPAPGKAAGAAEVLDALSQLPRRTGKEDDAAWPYLELRIMERQPEPGLMHSVLEALEDRAVHFCRMVRVVPADVAAAERRDGEGLSGEALQSVSPMKLAAAHFRTRYDGEMPQPLVERFRTAEEAATHGKETAGEGES